MTRDLDAVVVGSGPNGLAAAITLARAGLSVRVYEAASTIGGGLRPASLTLPGVTHDVCAAIHATAIASPFTQSPPLTGASSYILLRRGLIRWTTAARSCRSDQWSVARTALLVPYALAWRHPLIIRSLP